MDNNIIALAAYTYMLSAYNYMLKLQSKGKIKKTIKRRWWMVGLHNSRARYDGRNLLEDLVHEPSGNFENFCRMSSCDFEFLLGKIGQSIIKKDTCWRKAIPIKVHLAVTLRFLATGDTYKSLHYLFKISPQIISKIVPEVCKAIINALQDEVKMPTSADEWITKALEFYERWQFPNCIGSIDGKHVLLQSPINSGSDFYNYKHSFSIVLLAIVDSDYNFIFADVGCQGRISDGGVFRNSVLMEKINGNNTNFPNDTPLPGRNTNMPFVFVADNAFSLSTRIMKSFPGNPHSGSKNRIFNTRLSRTRVVVENAFGILSSVFRIFKKPMYLQPDQATTITLTCIYLHNFLRKSRSSRSLYAPDGSLDYIAEGELREGNWRQYQPLDGALRGIDRVPIRPPRNALNVREEFANFFSMRQ